jgi:hypothetical protein
VYVTVYKQSQVDSCFVFKKQDVKNALGRDAAALSQHGWQQAIPAGDGAIVMPCVASSDGRQHENMMSDWWQRL